MIEREPYEPNPEEIEKTESMMTNEERELSIEREKEQEQFEFFTRQAIDRFRDTHDTRGHMLVELYHYALENNIHSGLGAMFTLSATRVIAGYLLNAKGGKYQFSSLQPPPELRNPHVLEIGGFDGEELKWPSAQAFVDGFNYTGIDNDPILTEDWVVDQGWVKDKGTRSMGKLNERLAMDVMDVDKKLTERKYELIFGIAFLGYPTRSSAEKKGLSASEYESRILTKLKSVLREGGLMFFLNRENARLSADDISKLGFEVVEKEYVGHQLLVLRKIPEAEKKT